MEKLIDQETTGFLIKRFKEELTNKVEVKLYSDLAENNEYAGFTKAFLDELTAISDKITVSVHTSSEFDHAGRPFADPLIVLDTVNGAQLIYNGVPAGHEAGPFIEAIVMASTGKSRLPENLVDEISELSEKTEIQVFITPTCPHCPHMAHLSNMLAVALPEKITSEIIEATENPELSQQFKVSSVPMQLINWDAKRVSMGVQPESKFIKMILGE